MPFSFMAKAITAALSAGTISAIAPYVTPTGQEFVSQVINTGVVAILGGGLSGFLTYLVPNRKKV